MSNKKIFASLIIIVFTFIFFNINVYAYQYTCKYDYTTSEKGLFQIKYDFSAEIIIDTDSKTIKFPDGIFTNKIYFLDKLGNANYTDEYLVENLNGGCQSSIVFCSLSDNATGEFIDYGIFYDESNFYSLNWSGSEILSYYILLDKEYDYNMIHKDWCGIAYYNEESTGVSTPSTFDCTFLDTTLEKIEELDCSNGKNCNVNQRQEYKTYVEKTKSFCRSVLEHANYGLSPCLKGCLNVTDKLESDLSLIQSKCGLSGKLIIWISNIVRWGKYLVPIIVIVLGILDFIKAISSEKDDEMKKAQGRFVKRLIAAALIFIIPFIIEFVLNKMGFDSNGCGIIDL